MVSLRHPVAEDGVDIPQLVEQCPPLDTNSRYCNLIQAHHFRDTSIVAERDGEMVGFISGHRIPDRSNVLFVWQVAVSPAARGEGLGVTMLEALLRSNSDVEFIETTVTPDNEASAKMFQRLADSYCAPIATSTLFSREVHFEGLHDDEVLFRIGPIKRVQADRLATTPH